MYDKNQHERKDLCTRMFVKALFIAVKKKKEKKLQYPKICFDNKFKQ